MIGSYSERIVLSNSSYADSDKLLRAAVILVCGMLLFNLPVFIYKVKLSIKGVLYFFLCWDKSWETPEDPGLLLVSNNNNFPVSRKTVYFVRHGESTWNDTFNKGKHRSVLVFVLGFLPGLVKALFYELYLVLSGKLDSWFCDSPLSYLGLSQVDELAQFLQKQNNNDDVHNNHLSILNADPGAPKSKLLSSNLRRSVSTIAGGFAERLTRRRDDKILVIPCLQEISRNPDTLSITPPHSTIQASWIERRQTSVSYQAIFTTQTDMSLHVGNKPLNTNGLKRMLEFCRFVHGVDEDYVIVGGHSIWFRSFFRTFLPYTVSHVSKDKKIVNGGIVVFELVKVDTPMGSKYMVDDKTIRVVYGGF